MNQSEWCRQVTRACDEIALVYAQYPTLLQEHKHLALLGEVDWLEELHRLLHEEILNVTAD